MAILIIESWDGYGQTDNVAPGAAIEEKWSLDRTAARIQTGRTGKGIQTGSQLIANAPNGAKLGNHEYTTFGFNYRHGGLNTTSFVAGVLDGNNLAGNVIIMSTGELAVRKGGDAVFATGTIQLAPDTDYYIEFYSRTHGTLGEYELRINGVLELSGSGLNMRDGPNDYVNRFFISSGTLNAVFDDLYLNNDTNGNFLGDCYVEHLRPEADGSETGWTPDTGSDLYSRINETSPDGDTSYIETSGSSDNAVFDMEDLVGTGEIFGVQMNAHSKSGTYNFRVKNGGVSNNVDNSANTGSYVCYSWIWEVGSDGATPWDITEVNACEFGFTQTGASPRVTRFDIDVLYSASAGPSDIEQSVTSDLGATLGHTVEDDLETAAIEASASSVMSLLQTLGLNGEYVREPDDSEISLSQTLTYIGPKSVSVETIISFTDRGYKTEVGIAESEMSFTDEAVSENFTYVRNVPEGMYPGGVFNPLATPTFPADLLTLVQSVAFSGSQSRSVSSVFSLSQAVGVKQAVINKSVASIISFAETLGRPIDASASSVISFTQRAERVQSEKSLISLAGVASAFAVKPATSILTISHLLSHTFTGLRVVESDLNINHSVLYYNARLALECIYSPQIGFSGSGIVPPPIEMPTLGVATLTLTYPYSSPTSTVVLRNPSFGNVDRFNFMRIKSTSRGGSLIIYSHPDWPKERTFSISVDALRVTQVNDLRAFLTASLGKEIGLLNHENRLWKGIITTPELEITQTGRNAYSVSFEFEDTGPDVDIPPP